MPWTYPNLERISTMAKSSVQLVPEKVYKLTLAYHGEPYAGWQRQKGKVTVQLELEQAAAALYGQPILMAASGRTDTGVHARGQVVSFQAPGRHKSATILKALNAKLPDTIRVLQVRSMPAGFHARFSATGKTYAYHVYNASLADPFQLDTTWFMPFPLSLAVLRTGARHLVGEHDFASFASNPGYARTTTVRHIRWIKIARRGELITIRVHADGFLYKMVRNLVGALVKVGTGRLQPEELLAIREACSRSAAPPSAPAHGLFLESVSYGKKVTAPRYDPEKLGKRRPRKEQP